MDVRGFKAGTYKKQYEYTSFSPSLVDLPWVVSDSSLNHTLALANLSLGELNAFGQLLPDIDFFIEMHVAKEATTSSRIEGTRTTMEDVFTEEEDLGPEERNDWVEVKNYVQAMNWAIAEMEKLPLSNRLLRGTHKLLMQGVRGEKKTPGEFRTSQNWIGPSLKSAVYVPPVHTEIPELMGDLEKFLHNQETLVPDLIKIAIAHYQFETIHPFLDGNGRLGRLMITLYLVSAGILVRPTLYLSEYFSRHRPFYYQFLTEARIRNDMTQWVKFFLEGVIETSRNSAMTFTRVLKLKSLIEKERLPTLGRRAARGHDLVMELYRKPVITAAEVEDKLGVSAATSQSLLAAFVNLGILKEATGFKRNRRYVFAEYLGLFE